MSKYAIVRKYEWGQWAYACGDKFNTVEQAKEHVREFNHTDCKIVYNNAHVLQQLNKDDFDE